MKRVFVILAFVCSSIAFGQVSKISQLFDQYQYTEGVTSIKIAKPMFQLLGQLDIEDSDMAKIKPLINKINSLKILIVERDSSNARNYESIQSQLKSALKGIKYEELISINSENSNIRFLAESTKSDMLSNLLLCIDSGDETVFMILEGIISMEDVSKLISNE